jgi:hypothetical protein
MLATFAISFASVWLYVFIMERVAVSAQVHERRPVDSMFDPDLLAW